MYEDRGEAPVDAVPALIALIQRADAPEVEREDALRVISYTVRRMSMQSIRDAHLAQVLVDVAERQPDVRFKAIRALRSVAGWFPTSITSDDCKRIAALRRSADQQTLEAIGYILKAAHQAPQPR